MGDRELGVSGAAWALVAAALANLWGVSRTLGTSNDPASGPNLGKLRGFGDHATALAPLMAGGLAVTDAIGAAIALIVFGPAGAVIYLLSHFALWRLAGSPDGLEYQVMEFLVRAIQLRR